MRFELCEKSSMKPRKSASPWNARKPPHRKSPSDQRKLQQTKANHSRPAMDNWVRPEFFRRSIAKKVGRFCITEKTAGSAFSGILLLSRLFG
jgi:hypothetical protein